MILCCRALSRAKDRLVDADGKLQNAEDELARKKQALQSVTSSIELLHDAASSEMAGTRIERIGGRTGASPQVRLAGTPRCV